MSSQNEIPNQHPVLRFGFVLCDDDKDDETTAEESGDSTPSGAEVNELCRSGFRTHGLWMERCDGRSFCFFDILHLGDLDILFIWFKGEKIGFPWFQRCYYPGVL